MEIDANRLLTNLQTLRSIGAYKTGVHRPTYGEDDMIARHWLVEQLRDAGYSATIDGIGNVFGTSARKPVLLVGSHLESLNHAGWLDGALGVVYALEIGSVRPDLIDVVAWADEEGHYGSFLGSRSFVGDVSEEEIDQARNQFHALPLRAALSQAGLDSVERALLQPRRYGGYLEAHIEQGIELEAGGNSIGIVSDIVGVWQYRVCVTGEQNHAGTTTMVRRKDAGAAAIGLANDLLTRLPAVAGPHSVWTFGNVKFEPGSFSVIPGRAELHLQFRDTDRAILERMEACLAELVQEAGDRGPCAVTVENVYRSMPASMHGAFQNELLQAATARASGKICTMPSGAQHDAQILARVMPAGMMFIPSINGVSHHWTEDTSDADIVLGCQVFADAIERIAAAIQPPA